MNNSTHSTKWIKRFSFLVFQLLLVLMLNNTASGETALITVSGTRDPVTVKAVDHKSSSGQANADLAVDNPPEQNKMPLTDRDDMEPTKIKTTYEHEQLVRLIQKKTVIINDLPQ